MEESQVVYTKWRHQWAKAESQQVCAGVRVDDGYRRAAVKRRGCSGRRRGVIASGTKLTGELWPHRIQHVKRRGPLVLSRAALDTQGARHTQPWRTHMVLQHCDNVGWRAGVS